jgi:hypothetical protein
MQWIINTIACIVLIIIMIIIIVCVTGCSHMQYTSSDGASITINRFGYDTKIGRLHAERSPNNVASIDIENWDSQSRMAEVALALAKLVASNTNPPTTQPSPPGSAESQVVPENPLVFR